MRLLKTAFLFVVVFIFLLNSITINIFAQYDQKNYTVQNGDTLYKVSNLVEVTVNDIKAINNLQSDILYTGQILIVKTDTHIYTVKSGDSLYIIAKNNGLTVDELMLLNNLKSQTIYIGQSLKIMPDTINYTVKSGDSLWLIANRFKLPINDIIKWNKLTNTTLFIGQQLLIPYKLSPFVLSNEQPAPQPLKPTPVLNWPSITYIVQSGDSATTIASKFKISTADLLKYNYMTINDWFSSGQKIAINGYAPRNYDVYPNIDGVQKENGHLTDWFLDGQYYLKRNIVFTITDYYTKKQFTVKVLGGYNHCDIEPLTANDTAVIKSLWPVWNWNPRPVVVYLNGMNIAASLSGMPHSYDSISTNNVSGHFDLYLKNSIPHGDASKEYISQHYSNVYIAAGIK